MPHVPGSEAIPPPGTWLSFSMCSGAKSHPPAHGTCPKSPFPKWCKSSCGVSDCLDMDTVAEKGNPREAESPGPIETIPVPLSSPLESEQILSLQQLQTLSSPLLSHKELQYSFTSTSIQKGKLERDSVQVPGSAPWIHGVPTQAAGSIPCLLFPRSLALAVPPLPRHQGILGKHSSSLLFPKYRGSTVTPFLLLFPRGCGPQWHCFLFQLDPGIARIPQRVLRLREEDSQLQRLPKATGIEGLQKTPEEAKQQRLSILKLPETH